MAAVAETKTRAAKFDSQVDEQLAQTTSRIRTHDLAFGGLLLVALVLIYATAMIVLDKTLVLPEWVRQFALAGFLGLLVSVGYFAVIRPLRRRINPLYAAKQVERTIDDNKNSVTGYVDAQEKGNLNPTVKAALASRAAQAAAEADVNRAVDHRSLIYIGGVVVAFLLTLIVLFFVFRPAPFASLMNRAFVPFSSDSIANQTTLTLVQPEPPEPTITVGQSIPVAVHVGGRVPSPDSPERVRLLIRHNPLATEYDELPMVQGETGRDWELRVPDYLIQNGFWYKVAAGDAVTPEYRVTVRSLPMFQEFQAIYDYPDYLRRAKETANDPVIRAYRGTKVTLVAKANRALRDGLMVIEPGNQRVPGALVPGKPDSVQFVFKLTQSGRYKLSFNATNGETIAEPFAAPITVEADQAPQLIILKPEEDEIQLPANGQLAVDGTIGDDFGIDTVTLKMKLVEPAERPLPDVPYLNGKERSFLREKDNTWPTDLTYKGSVDLAKLTKDAAGLPLTVSPNTVIEYWLEATDNCTEPKPNVGKSAPKRVRLTEPKKQEAEKEQLDQQKDARQNEEKQHNAQQQQQLDKEKREPKNGQPQQNPENEVDPKGGEKQPDAKTEPKEGDGKGEPKTDGQPKTGGEPKKGDPKTDGADGKGMGSKDMGQPMNKDAADPQPKNPNDPNNMGGMEGTGSKEPAPMPKTPEQRDIEKTAEDFRKEIEKENQQGGSAKPNPTPSEQERTDPGQAKPEPKDGMGGMNNMGNAAETKPEPKQPNPNDPKQPMGKGKSDSAPATAKPEGKLEQPQDPATSKPDPKQADGMPGQKDAAPSEKRSEPFGAPPGTDKPTPKEPQPTPKNPETKQDPASGSEAKPATQKKGGDVAPGMPDPKDKPDPAADAGSKSKPMPENTRGADKPAQPKAAPPGDTKPEDAKKPNAGDAKPQQAPPAGDAKPQPKDDPMMGMDSQPKPADGANKPQDLKKPNATGAAENKPDEGKQPPMGGKQDVAKGIDKPQPKDDKGAQNAGTAPQPKQKELSAEEKKKLEEAAKNLTSPDPKKKDEARQTLDKAVGEENRKEMEKLANDLQSDDKKTRDAARQKLDDLKKEIEKGNAGGQPKKEDAPKLTKEQQKEIEDAVKDLQNPDPAKKQEAQKKLDKMIGEENRKEVEQMMDDLKSDDKDKREAAQKKLDNLKEQTKNFNKGQDGPQPKGKEPSPEEMKELAKKAQDLNSPDQKTREQAQKDLDEKIGKENRQKLEEELKNKKMGDPPTDPADLQRKLKEWQEGLGQGTPNKGPMELDPKEKLKNAELNLSQFESDEYRKKLQSMKGWTDAEYDNFLKGYQDYIKNLKNEVAGGDKPPMSGVGPDPDKPFGSVGSGKVERTGPATTGPAGVGGPTVAPPGFEDAKRKFEEALKKKN